MHDKSADSFTCIEGAGNVHIAKRYAHANVNTERACSMHDKSAHSCTLRGHNEGTYC